MAGPWEKFAAAPAPEAGPWTAYAQPAEAPAPAAAAKPFNVLPFSEDAQGKVSFDINAGLPGALIRAVKAPYDAMTGQFDPMSPEGQQRALETALTISPGSPALRAGERTVPGLLTSARREKVKPPTAEELKTASSKGYDAARDTGAEYPGPSIGELSTNAQRSLETDGIIAELAPQTFAVLNKLSTPPEGSVVTISSLDAARKALNRISGNFQNPTEQEAARRVIRGIDGFIERGSNGAGSAAGGTGAALPVPASAAGAGAPNGAGLGGMAAADPAQMEAARLIKEARGNAAAGFRSGRITGAEEAADLRAAAANSGQNVGNALRQRLASILLSDKQSRGFSKEELAAMRQVVEGTATSNTLRRVSNLLGGGGGLGQTMLGMLGGGTGAAVGGFPGAVIGGALPPVLGSATRAGYNALARRQVGKLDELVRKRSPLYQQRAATAPLLPMLSDQGAGLLLRGLLMNPPTGGLLGDPYQP